MKNKMLKILLTAMIIIAFGPMAFAQQTEQGYALIVEQSPLDAGFVTPGVGVHRLQLNETVTIQAIPKPGYRFIYWMGDVLDPTANRTSVRLDAPKMVIAVFERENFELLSRSNVSTGGSGSGGGSIRKPADSLSADVSVAQVYDYDYTPKFYEQPNWIYVPGDVDNSDGTSGTGDILVPGSGGGEISVPGNPEDPSEILVPGVDNQIPVPGGEDSVPEPATMAILAVGAIFLRKRNPSQRQK